MAQEQALTVVSSEPPQGAPLTVVSSEAPSKPSKPATDKPSKPAPKAPAKGGLSVISSVSPTSKTPIFDSLKTFADLATKTIRSVLPGTAEAQATGTAMLTHPIDSLLSLVGATPETAAVAEKAKTAFAQHDYATGARHLWNYLTPIIGSEIDTSQEEGLHGENAKYFGHAVDATIQAVLLGKGEAARLEKPRVPGAVLPGEPIPKLKSVGEPAAPVRKPSTVPQYEPVSTPTGQRRMGELPEGQAGLPAEPSAGVSDRKPAPGQRVMPSLPEGASGVPEASGGPVKSSTRPFGLRSRAPGEPVTELPGPTGPRPLANRKPAPGQVLLPELPETERANLFEQQAQRKAARVATEKAAKAPKAPIQKIAPKQLPVIPASPVSQIPASWMPHFEDLLSDARTQGFTGSKEDLAGHFVGALDKAIDFAQEQAGTGTAELDRQLLRTISKAGGFNIDREGGGGMAGELENMLPARRGVNKKTGKLMPAQMNRSGGVEGIPGIIRRGAGLSADKMREAVSHTPELAHLTENLSDFMEHVRTALQRTAEGKLASVKSSDVEGALVNFFGVKAGARWWDAGGAPDDVTSEANLTRRVEGTLDDLQVPRSHQAAIQADLSSTIARLRQQLGAAGTTVQDVLDYADEYARGRAEDYHAQENMPALRAGAVDTLATGEAQPRLPGDVGQVREQEVAGKQFELPPEENFLKAENARPDERQPPLWSSDEERRNYVPPKHKWVKDADGRLRMVEDDDVHLLHGGIGAVELPPRVRDFVEGVREKARKALEPDQALVQSKDALRQTFSDVAIEEERRRAMAVKVFKWWQSLPTDRQVAFTSDYERSGAFPASIDPDGSYSKAYQESTDRAHAWAEEGFKNDNAGYIDHYVRHVFEIDPKDVEAASKILQNGSARAMSANRSVLRHRLFRMPVDEALKAMAAKGIKAKLVETNPELLRQWVVNNAYRALRFRELGDYLKDQGLVKAVKAGEEPPAGYKRLPQEKYGIYFKGEQGLVYAGNYWASAPVAKLLSRATSVGIENKYFRGMRETNLIWNQMNLGFSMFHATETAINALASEMARAVQAAGHGELGQAAKSLARSATVLGPGIRDLIQGRAFVNGVMNGDPAIMNVLNEVFKPAGGRLLLEKRYLTDHYDTFKQAWKDNDIIRTVGHGVAAVPEKLSWVLMNYTIPRIKLGAFLDLAADVQRRMPNASFAERQRAYALAWDAMDDRFGLLTHDNLFWHRKVSDIAQFSIRSVGWSYGTVRSFGGSAIDVAKGAGHLFTGDMTAAKAKFLSDRVAFTLGLTAAMAYVGIWYQYLHTGKLPDTSSMKSFGRDVFHPQDGGVDANGDPTRATIKSYISDLENYYRDPSRTVLHKASPEVEALIAATPWVGTNENFFGDLVRNPDDPIGEQSYQTGKFLWESFSPFAVQQGLGAYKSGTPVVESVERGFGVQKAPAWVVKTDLEKAILKSSQARLGERHRTPEQVETDHANQDLVRQAAAYRAFSGSPTWNRQQRAEILRQVVGPNWKTLSKQAIDAKLMAFIRKVKQPISETWATLPWTERVKLARQFPAEVQRRFPEDWRKIITANKGMPLGR